MPGDTFLFWLIPSAPLKTQLTSLVEKLAADYGAVPFTPHVTLYVGLSDENEAQGIARKITGEFSSVELTFDKLDYTNLFYKTLFVQFRESSAARKICERIRASCARPSNYALNPHLSLMYKRKPEAGRQKLCSALAVPEGNYVFDSLRVVAANTEESDQAIREWRTVSEGRLKN